VEAYHGIVCRKSSKNTQQRSGQHRGCSAYNDFRELLEKQKDLDAKFACPLTVQ